MLVAQTGGCDECLKNGQHFVLQNKEKKVKRKIKVQKEGKSQYTNDET